MRPRLLKSEARGSTGMGQLVTRTLGTLPRGDREDTRLTRALGEMG